MEELRTMRHTREEVIQRAEREYEQLDRLIAGLSDAGWARPLPRPETKDPWTVKDAVAHVTHWKADVARSIRGLPRPPEERGLNETQENQLVYMRWRDRTPQEALAWHRQVHQEILAALRSVPEVWFTKRERRPEWPYDLDGHLADHRVKDIQRALEGD
jgi:hypothetical protein